jgi:uncharacterized protein (DUF1697 family)
LGSRQGRWISGSGGVIKGASVALVVLLRGVNIGGHRTFQPTKFAQRLKHLDAISIGSAGTFVIRKRVTRAQLRAEFARRLPFDAEIMICSGQEIVRLMSRDHFAGQSVRPGIVRFVTILPQGPRSAPSTPMTFPSSGKWLLKILATENRFVFGLYRRHMKVISYLGKFDRLFGVPVTTRNWNTITAIAKVLGDGATRSTGQRRQKRRPNKRIQRTHSRATEAGRQR